MIAHNEELALCARVESKSKCGESGWLHKLTKDPAKPPRWTSLPKKKSEPRPGLGLLAIESIRAVSNDELYRLSKQLGVTAFSLQKLHIGWTGYAWSFPMTDCDGNTLGIRLRFDDGKKRSVPGGKEGLFIPCSRIDTDDTLMVCEGPTDTAALLDMGFGEVVGRPSCNGVAMLMRDLVKKYKTSRIVIVSDSEAPGLRGAMMLASNLCDLANIRVTQPPAGIKDAREWLRKGGTKNEVLSCLT